MADSTAIVMNHSDGSPAGTITKVVSATLRDALDGECTLSFAVLAEMAMSLEIGDSVSLSAGAHEYAFKIVRVAKSLSGGLRLCSVTCEHMSYELNDEAYSLTPFDFTGEPLAGLQQLLDGTNLTAGSVDFTGSVALKINQKCSRRAALMQYVALLGGEMEYSGLAINIRSHRGSGAYLEVMGGKAVSDVRATNDSRAVTATYNLTL